MKRIFTLLFLTFFIGSASFAQKSYINYSKDSRWFLGINAGATWHSRTEVSNLVHGGYGFTFGRSFGMKPEKLFSWDLRFRYLHGWWGGQSTNQYALDSNSTSNLNAYPSNILQQYQDTSGYFIPNFRTQLISGSLELALNTNRLRENTGWNIQIFGGIGVKGFNTRADLTDNSGQIYDYSTTNLTKPALLSLQDGNYETNIIGSDGDFEIDWMGSFGAGISYQIAPWVSFGLSHKMTWTRSNDLFDGMPNDAAGIPTSGNDIYHYSSAGFKFHLFGGNHTPKPDPIVENPTDINNFDKPDTNPIVNTPTVQKPIVDIYDPGVSPYTVEYDHFNIRAYVHNVVGKQNISFKQNGNTNNNFTYNAASDQFSSNVILQPGQNIFEITGWNEAGQDYESTIIIYKRDVPVVQPPIVSVTNPPYSPYTTNNSTFNFSGTVLNVDSKSQIKVYLNGANLTNFTYEAISKAVYATLNLQEGTNTVTITATNSVGSDSKMVKIIYEKPVVIQPPMVNIIYPSVDPYATANQSINVTATVFNVDGKNNITVKINGHPTSNFTYNSTSKNVNFAASLLEGANVIEVIGANQAGVASDNTTIIYDIPESPKPPIVTFKDPNVGPTIVYAPSYNVVAKVDNVASASDITLKINGVQSYNFSYSTSSKLMTFTSNLLVGANVLEVTGTNSAGSDTENTTIMYKKVVPQAPPVVTISYPSVDNQVFNTANITLGAAVLNVNSAANILLLVNGTTTNSFTYNTATKQLLLPLNLQEGANTVKITGTNTAGTDTETRVIIYKKPVVPAPPTVVFVNPPSSPFLVNNENYQITASTTNIDSKSQITLLHNGNLIADNAYTFNSNHQIIYNSQLIQGSNIFEAIVTNNDGTDSKMTIVTYKVENAPCIIPTVGYISPVPYSTVADPNILVDAQINNYTQGTTIQLVVNGVSQGYMTFNSNTSLASKSTVLNEGSNSVTVIVTNNCGTNQATFTLNYVAPEAPCVDPVVTANGPLTIVTQTSSTSITAGVSQVSNANQIVVTINGQNVPFTYDQGTNSVSVQNAPLTMGNNTLAITATNDCGSGTLLYQIMRKECNLPIISNPSHQSGSTSSTVGITFSANVSNAVQSEIELVINNISQPFTFNDQNGLLSTAINLVEGVNTIVVTAINSCGTKTQSFTITHEIPCEPIAFSLLTPSNLAATVTNVNYSILLHVTGSIEASGVQATLNGAAINSTFDAVAGNVSVTGITLVDGLNNIVITLTNDCSSEIVNYQITYNGCQPPVITINGLTNGAVLNTNTANLQATILNSNGAGNITLTVNGTAQSFDFDDQSNLLTAVLNLNEGANSISIVVAGCETKSQVINITYNKPCLPISYNLMQPNVTAQTVTSNQYQLTLNLAGVENAQQVTVSINGNSYPFTFDTGSQILTINGITLVDGMNNIIVTATNDCSAETISYQITYNGCQPPVISLGTNPSTASAAAYSFTSTVTNIANQSMIQVLLNGGPVSFVYNPTGGIITADLQLVEGVNSIQILANGCASDDKSFNVTYTIPCSPIVYSLANPTQLQTSIADDTYVLTLVAQNANASSISVKLNGVAVPHTYINDLITTSPLTLADGANAVVITMSNACSNETITYAITHDGCQAPTINLQGNADAVTTQVYNLTATLSNVSSQNELVVKLNGASVPFTFNSGNGQLTAQLTLNVGANVITVEANTCASSAQTLNVSYTVPCNPVTYTLVVPNQLSFVVDGASTSISLNVQNVTNASNVSATLNGAVTNVTFANNIISLQNINLNDGANVITVTFGNACSSETVTYAIESDQCDTPIITVSNNNMVTSDPLYTFTCNVQNVNSGSDIVVNINGQNVPSNFANGVLTAQMSLQEGANEVTVTANGCETTSVTYTITYQVPCNPITYSLMIPATNDTIYQETTSTMVKVNALNVDQAGVSAKLNGVPVAFSYLSGSITVNTQSLVVGNNTIVISMTNDCSTSAAVFHILVGAPCVPPTVNITNQSNNVENATLALTATTTNVGQASQIVLLLNGQSVPFNFSNGAITANLTLNQGANNIVINVTGCQSAQANWAVTYTAPCAAPTVAITNQNNNVENATLALTATTTNVDQASQIVLLLNGQSVPFNYSNGAVTANLTLNQGANTVVINVTGCQNAQANWSVTYTAPAVVCGPRFNPGNSAWEFCLVTPDGTFTRDDLANNANFTYSGPATAAYFKPIAGGGNAVVNGQPYVVQNGQYYLFEGSLTVDVSSSHPGSMGHWEICIQSNAEPTHGNGNNRPASPCESTGNQNNGGSTNPDFEIGGDGTVHVNDNFCATIKCLGESVVYNNSQDAYVTVQYSINGGTNWYQFNNNNYVNGGEQLTVQAPAGSDIVIKSICVNQNGNWTNTEISNTGSQYVYVLKDGDQAPNFAPSQGQASVETFLAGLVDNQGNVSIGPNDVIYLFELRFVGNYGIDYQDCVMLITLDEGTNCAPPSNPAGGSNNHGQIYLAPKFTHIKPQGLTTSVNELTYDLKTKIENVNDPADVKLYLNGTLVQSFKYDVASQLLTANLKLRDGSNSIKIEAVNGDKTNQVTYTVNYQAESNTTTGSLKPVITNINPNSATGSTTSSAYTFKASIVNVNAQNDIQLILNGTAVTNFTYSSSTKQVSAVLKLREGNNTIKLSALNGTNSAEQIYTINYSAPIVVNTIAPTITNVNPSSATSETENISYKFSAKVAGVKSQSDIKLTLNGSPVIAFTYSSSTQLVSAVLKLRNGSNSVKIEAANGDKTANTSYTINYVEKPVIIAPAPLKPTITNISPSGASETVSSASYMFKAKLQNVTSNSGVQLTLNGANITTFTYSSGSGDVSAVLKLREGSNTVVVKAINGTESATQTYTITYTPTATTKPGTTITKPGTTTGGGTTTTTKPGTTTGGGTTTTTKPGTTTGGGTTTTTKPGTTTGGGTTTTTKPGTTTVQPGTTTVKPGTTTTGGGTTTTTKPGTTTVQPGTTTVKPGTTTTKPGTTTEQPGTTTVKPGTTTTGGTTTTTKPGTTTVQPGTTTVKPGTTTTGGGK